MGRKSFPKKQGKMKVSHGTHDTMLSVAGSWHSPHATLKACFIHYTSFHNSVHKQTLISLICGSNVLLKGVLASCRFILQIFTDKISSLYH